MSTVPEPVSKASGGHADYGLGAESNELAPRQLAVIFTGLGMAMVTAVGSGTAVITALPEIAGDLGGFDRISWLVTASLLGQVAGMPIFGKLGDLLGRKRILQTVLASFLAGSLLAGFAFSMSALIVFRGLQGIAAGGILVVAQGIIGDVVPARRRGRYMSALAPIFGIGTIGGPLLGGVLVDQVGWRWIFFINLPLVIATMAVIAATIKLAPTRRRPRIDYPGALLLAAAVTTVVLLTTWAGTTYRWDSGVIVGLLAGTVALLAGWVLVERRAAEPVLPLNLFRDRVFTVAIALSFGVGLAMFTAITYLPTFLQIAAGASATHSGLLLLPLLGAMIAAGMVTGQLMTYTGRYKVFPIVGMATATAGLYLLSTITATSAHLVIYLAMAVVGVGIGVAMTVLTTAVQNSVARTHLGTATSSVNLLRQMGGALGVAIGGTLFTTRLAQHLRAQLPAHAAHRIAAHPEALTPKALTHLPSALQQGVATAVGQALPSIFLDLAPVLAACFLLAWFLKERPLATSTHPSSQAPAATSSATAASSTTGEPSAPTSRSTRSKGSRLAEVNNHGEPGLLDEAAAPGICGTVRDATSGNLATAVLTLIKTSGAQISRTDTGETGHYTIPAPGPGDYILIATADAHEPEARFVAVPAGPASLDFVLSERAHRN
jgi:EmrB/QacA subfamily drug resistance transporter